MEQTFAKLADAPFLTSLIQQLAEKLELLGGTQWTAEETGSPTPQSDDDASFLLQFEGAIQGTIVLRADAMALDAMRSAAALDEEADTAVLIEKWFEPALASLLETRASGEWTVHVEAGENNSEPAQSFGIAMHAADGTTIRLTLAMDATAAESIQILAAQAAVLSYQNPDDPKAMNLDLVLDVELNVVLRFGQRQLTLREVLDLTSGSVIELDRQVEEPVELLLEGKVIARGEAVVIDGNYGLRVTELPQPISHQMLA